MCYWLRIVKENCMKVSYNCDVDKFITATCENPEVIRTIMQLRVEFLNIPNYNNFYFSENGDRKDNIQFLVEANGNYAYLQYIDGDYQYQSLNDGNNLEIDSETDILPFAHVSYSNAYFVTIETAIKAAIEFCKTKTRPTNVQWEPVQQE